MCGNCIHMHQLCRYNCCDANNIILKYIYIDNTFWLERPISAADVTHVKKVGGEHIIYLSAAGSKGCASYEWKHITK